MAAHTIGGNSKGRSGRKYHRLRAHGASKARPHGDERRSFGEPVVVRVNRHLVASGDGQPMMSPCQTHRTSLAPETLSPLQQKTNWSRAEDPGKPRKLGGVQGWALPPQPDALSQGKEGLPQVKIAGLYFVLRTTAPVVGAAGTGGWRLAALRGLCGYSVRPDVCGLHGATRQRRAPVNVPF